MAPNLETAKQTLLDGDNLTRVATCEQLKKLGKSGIAVLVSVLCERPKNANELENHRAAQAVISDALIEIGPDVVPELISALKGHHHKWEPDYELLQAIPIFVALRDQRALETLSSRYESMKKSGQALGGLLLAVRLPEAIAAIKGDDGGFEILIDALDENDEHKIGISSDVAEALGRWGDLNALPHLMNAARRVYFHNGTVRGQNIGALRGLAELVRNHPGAIQPDTLREMLRLPDQYSQYGPQQVYSSFREVLGNELKNLSCR
jgi:HEAT repeat protein